MPIKQMSRREVATLIDARRDVPGYGDSPPAWTLPDMVAWMQAHLGREISESQASGFARDAGIQLLMRKPVRRSMDSGAKFIGHCLMDLYEELGVAAPTHLRDWLQHRITLDDAAQMRAEYAALHLTRQPELDSEQEQRW